MREVEIRDYAWQLLDADGDKAVVEAVQRARICEEQVLGGEGAMPQPSFNPRENTAGAAVTDLDDETISEILVSQPTLSELREVAAWGRDEDNMIIRIAIRNLVCRRRFSTY